MGKLKVGDAVRFVNVDKLENFAKKRDDYFKVSNYPKIVPEMLQYLNGSTVTKILRTINDNTAYIVSADDGAWRWPSFCFERVDSKNLEIE